MGKLSKEEQIALVLKAQSGDKEAEVILVENALGFVAWKVKNILNEEMYQDRNLSWDDLFQAGGLGLFQSIYSFKPGYNASFLTYASYKITEAIKEEIKFETGNSNNVVSTEENLEILDVIESSEPSVLDTIIDEENNTDDVIYSLTKCLSEDERRVLYMFYGIGCERETNHRKIGKALNLSEITVRKLVTSSMSKIKNMYKDE